MKQSLSNLAGADAVPSSTDLPAQHPRLSAPALFWPDGRLGTIKQAILFTNLSRTTFYDLMKEGAIKPLVFRRGKRRLLRFDKDALRKSFARTI